MHVGKTYRYDGNVMTVERVEVGKKRCPAVKAPQLWFVFLFPQQPPCWPRDSHPLIFQVRSQELAAPHQLTEVRSQRCLYGVSSPALHTPFPPGSVFCCLPVTLPVGTPPALS